MEQHTARGKLGSNAVPPKSAIQLGDKFTSFAELQRRLQEHKEVTFTEYWIRDNRTLVQASKRVPDRVRCSKLDLKYYYVKFTCVHGGQKLKEKPKRSARLSHSLKQGCGAYIYCTLSDDGQSLIVKSMVDEHNHPLNSRKSFRLLKSKQIKFVTESESKKSTEKNTHKLAAQESMTGLNYKMDDDFQLCVMILEGRGCQVEVLTCENEFKGIYFQDKTMARGYQSFPEFLFIDGTYKLADLRTSLYLFVVVDSIGNFEIVAVAVLYLENKDCIDWLVSTFKDKNPKWVETCVVMTDTNPIERQVLKKHFSNARLLICQFHVMKDFRRSLTMSELNITQEEEMHAKECIQNIIYSKCLDDYNELYEDMMGTLPVQVMKYYNDNWHSIRQEWVLGFSEETGVFLGLTSNRVASVNRRLRSKFAKQRFLKQFVDEFFVDLQKQRDERESNVINMLHEVPEQTCSDVNIKRYMDVLTKYAFKYVEQQYVSMDQVSNAHYTIAGGTYLLNTSSSKKVSVTPKSCECSFFNSMGLPCRHVLFVRHHLKMDLFDANLCLERWTKKFYTGPRRVLQPLPTNDVTTLVQEVQKNDVFAPKHLATLSPEEKESSILLHTNKLAALASKLCDESFNECLLLVTRLVESCENLDEVDLNELLKDSAALSGSRLSRNWSKCEMSETASPQVETCPSVKNSAHVSMSPTQETSETLVESRTRKRPVNLNNSTLQNRCGLPKKKKSARGSKAASCVSPTLTKCATVSVLCTPWMSHKVSKNESNGNTGVTEHAKQVNVVLKNDTEMIEGEMDWLEYNNVSVDSQPSFVPSVYSNQSM